MRFYPGVYRMFSKFKTNFVLPLAFYKFFLCIPYFHWECCILNTRNWHLTSSGLLGPQRCRLGLLDNLFRVRPSPTEHGLYSVHLKSAPAETQTRDFTFGPSQASPSLLCMLSPRTNFCYPFCFVVFAI